MTKDILWVNLENPEPRGRDRDRGPQPADAGLHREPAGGDPRLRRRTRPRLHRRAPQGSLRLTLCTPPLGGPGSTRKVLTWRHSRSLIGTRPAASGFPGDSQARTPSAPSETGVDPIAWTPDGYADAVAGGSVSDGVRCRRRADSVQQFRAVREGAHRDGVGHSARAHRAMRYPQTIRRGGTLGRVCGVQRRVESRADRSNSHCLQDSRGTAPQGSANDTGVVSLFRQGPLRLRRRANLARSRG